MSPCSATTACWDACTPRSGSSASTRRAEVAIRRSFSEDLYLTLAGYEMQAQAATYKVTINPLVNWIWAGFGVTAVGTLIALMPERVCVRRRPSPGRSGDDRAVSADAVHAGGSLRRNTSRTRRPLSSSACAAREGHAAGAGVHLPHVREEEHRGM